MVQARPEKVHDVDAHAQLLDMLFGYWRSQVLRAIADLSIADHLAGGPLSAAEVATRENSGTDYTYRLMRAGVAMGVLTADADSRFHTTALLDTLRKDEARSLRDFVLAMTATTHWLPWHHLVDAVRTGCDPATTALGTDVFTYFERNPDAARLFNGAMASLTGAWAGHVADLIDTTGVARAVDVGGGNGSLLRTLQEANPALRGVIFDRPNVAAEVAAEIGNSEFSGRTAVLGGDFFESVPTGDLLLLKMILHDWDDDHCVTILRRCREALAPGARLAIVEMLLGKLDAPGLAALMDLNMLVCCPDGRERSLAEFDALLQAAGLRRTAVHLTGSPHSIIEAVAA